MPRRRYVWSPERNELVEVSTDYNQPPRSHYVIPDTPDYVSPVSGVVISGRRQRRNDLAKTSSRPWEGLKAEKQEAQRRQQYAEQKFDAGLERSARQAYHQMDPAKRRVLEGRG
jgi:hypothetical protein